METMTPEDLLGWLDGQRQLAVSKCNYVKASLMRDRHATVRDLIANQREQPEPVAPKHWPDAAGVWARGNLVAFFERRETPQGAGIVGRSQSFGGEISEGNRGFVGGWLPCTVTPHPAKEPEPVPAKPLMLCGKGAGNSSPSWFVRVLDGGWLDCEDEHCCESSGIIEVDEAATDCPEAVALWRSEGGGQ